MSAAAHNALIVSKADLEDQRWLNQQVVILGDGIEAARDIWANWSDLRNVGRLHPGQSAGEYIASLGLRLTLAEAMAALPDGSNRQIAAVAAVDPMTVHRARVANATGDEPPARVIGADGKSYPGRVVRTTTAEIIEPDAPAPEPVTPPAWDTLARLLAEIEALAKTDDADALAAAVPVARQPSTARKLHKVVNYLHATAYRLDRMNAPTEEQERERRAAEEAARPEKARHELKLALLHLATVEAAPRPLPDPSRWGETMEKARTRVENAEDEIRRLDQRAEDRARQEARDRQRTEDHERQRATRVKDVTPRAETVTA
jgi:hypothetical protein